MGEWRHFVVAVGLCAAFAVPAYGADTYSYTVRHPRFGDIGTYTDRIERIGNRWHVDTTLTVVVKALGIVVHREEAHRAEVWDDGRLVAFRGVTTTNGTPLEVAGEARDGGFMVTTPTGSAMAPADVMPSDPWQGGAGATPPSATTMLSTKTGRLTPMQTSPGESMWVSLHGIELPVRHYVISGDKRHDVWVDPRGIPVRFRIDEDGTPIDFELSRDTLVNLVAALPR